MPSSEGIEVDVALSKRFREDHLVLYDKNVNLMASLKARRFPRAIAKGGYIGDVAGRLVRDGVKLTIASLDFTGTVQTVADEVCDFVESGVLGPGALVGINMVKGRENAETMEEIRSHEEAFSRLEEYAAAADRIQAAAYRYGQATALDTSALRSRVAPLADQKIAGRYGYLMHRLQGDPDPWFAGKRIPTVRAAGEYASKTQRMIWCIVKIHEQPCFCATCHCTILGLGARHGWSPQRTVAARREYYGLSSDDDLAAAIVERHQHIGFRRAVVPKLKPGQQIILLGAEPPGARPISVKG